MHIITVRYSRIFPFVSTFFDLEPTPSAANNKQQSTTPVSRQELLRKLHEKMPHRQQQEGFPIHFFLTVFSKNFLLENGVEPDAKRKRTKEKSKEREKKPRPTPVEWSAPSNKPSTPKPTSKSSTVPNQITFGRFDFKTEDTIDISSKKKKGKKPATKQKQLVNTLKKIEDEQNELNRLHDENPDEEKALLRSKHWKSAMAKAKGEKIRDNPQLLRKSIKKQQQLRARSAKKWKKNKSETDKRMKERQEKRTANLQKRKDEKKAKLKKRLIKKGRLIS